MKRMRRGNVPRQGAVILAEVQFTDTFEVKTRPAVVLFEERGNVVIAGVTSNTGMEGIPLTRKEGAVRESIIKLNYIFTISERMIKKELFLLGKEKRDMVINGIVKRLRE